MAREHVIYRCVSRVNWKVWLVGALKGSTKFWGQWLYNWGIIRRWHCQVYTTLHSKLKVILYCLLLLPLIVRHQRLGEFNVAAGEPRIKYSSTYTYNSVDTCKSLRPLLLG